MPTLHVVTKEVLDHLDSEQLPLSTVLSPNDIVSCISARDVAASIQARRVFSLSFDLATEIRMGQPLIELDSRDIYETHPRFVERVKENLSTLLLKEQQETTGVKHRCDVYTLHPVNDEHWVVGVQRRISEVDYPEVHAVKTNHAFLDALITHSLHRLSFEKVCSTNLFANYLKSL